MIENNFLHHLKNISYLNLNTQVLNSEYENKIQESETTISKLKAEIEKNNRKKKRVIGKDRERNKRVSMDARLDIEALLQKKVMLRTWIRVKKGWSHSAKVLKS